MSLWSIADVFEAVAAQWPDDAAIIDGDRRLNWFDFDQRANRLGAFLCERGLGRHAKVVQYLRNCPEYLESVLAASKFSFVPANTNYRYLAAELADLWTNADAEAVVFHGSFAERIEPIRSRLGISTWLWVDDGAEACPAWAISYEEAVAKGDDRRSPWERRPDDYHLLYTGGTTGRPKGVVWEQATLIRIIGNLCPVPIAGGVTLEQFLDGIRSAAERPVVLSAAPFMHGTGLYTTLSGMMSGGCAVVLPGPSFDPIAALDLVGRERVSMMVLVGDAFARPLADALDANPDRFDLSSLKTVISAGVMWSEGVRARLLRHQPGMVLVDSLGSSEVIGVGAAVSTGDGAPGTGRFAPGPGTIVLDVEGRPVEAGSGRAGRLGMTGLLPAGYYKDEAATARTFPLIDGIRYAFPGDWATVEADGTLTLLGRGSVCINTGGEKVFPEEVEEVLKLHPTVRDAVVVGVPDDRFGEVVAAIVEPVGDETDDAALIGHVRCRLAAYKAPRYIVRLASIDRGPNGKADYPALRQLVIDRLALK